MDISKEGKETSDKSQKENDTKKEQKKEVIEKVLEEIEENYVLSKEDAKIVIERLKLCRNLVGKDNQRVFMTLSKMIEEFEKIV